MRIVLVKEYVSENAFHEIMVKFRVTGIENEELKKLGEEIRELRRKRDEEIRKVFNLKPNQHIDYNEFGELCIFEKVDEGVGEDVRCLTRSEVKKYKEIVERYGEEIKKLEERRMEILRKITEDLNKKIPNEITLEI